MIRKCTRMLLTAIWLMLAGILTVFAKAPDQDIVILYTNDVHCGVDDHIGYAGLSLYKQEMQAETPYVALVDAGDAIQGAPIGSLSEGMYIIQLMNAVGYDVAVPGNHEFDYGLDALKECEETLRCGYTSCNITDLATQERVFEAGKILSFGDVKIGFVGVTTPETLITSNPDHFKDADGNYIYSFAEDDSGETLYGTIQNAVDEIREQGADYVILVGHLGETDVTERWSSLTVAAHLSGVDAVIDGHSHETTPGMTCKDKDGKDVIITQTGSKLANIGKLVIDTEGKIITELVDTVAPLGDSHTHYVRPGEDLGQIAKKELGNWLRWDEILEANSDTMEKAEDLKSGSEIVIPDSAKAIATRKGTVYGDWKVWNLLQEIKAQYADALEVVYGTTDFDLITVDPETGTWRSRGHETNLGDFVADALRHVMGADIGMMNGGGLRADIPEGEIQYKDILTSFPFGNMICLAELTGQEILDLLEGGTVLLPEESGSFQQVSGLSYRIDLSVPSGVKLSDKGDVEEITGEYRVKDVMVGSEPLDLDKTYTVAGHDYMLKYGGEGFNFRPEQIIRDSVITDVDCIATYIRDLGGTIPEEYKDPDGQGRIVYVTEEEEVSAENAETAENVESTEAAEKESAKEESAAEETKAAEEIEETESAAEAESAAELESAEEPGSAEETEAEQETESAEETQPAEETRPAPKKQPAGETKPSGRRKFLAC